MSALAQLSVLYEDLRIENFALIAHDDQVKPLDYLDKRYRINYFLRRSLATLLEFKGALTRLSRTSEYKAAKRMATSASKRQCFAVVSTALSFFNEQGVFLREARNLIGGHFVDQAADFATAHLEQHAVGKIEITLHPQGRGGGAKLHYAGEIAATAFTKLLPGNKARPEEIAEAILIIRDGYAHVTDVMHHLVVLFLWDRFDG